MERLANQPRMGSLGTVLDAFYEPLKPCAESYSVRYQQTIDEMTEGIAYELGMIMGDSMASRLSKRWQQATKFGINAGFVGSQVAKANGVPTAFTWTMDVLGGGSYGWYRALWPKVLLSSGEATLVVQAGWRLGVGFKVQAIDRCRKQR